MSSWTAIDDKVIGLSLAISGSFMIGISFIITKKGLMDVAEQAELEDEAEDDGFGPPIRRNTASEGVLPKYLSNYIWWAGMVTSKFHAYQKSGSLCLTSRLQVVTGEIANFAAYIFAPPILVAPLGGLSVIIGAVLASFLLKEELGRIGRVACTLCLIGSMIIVLHAPEDTEIATVDEYLRMALRPSFLFYCLFCIGFCALLITRYCPLYGHTNPIFYITICSLIGSLSVMAIKALGIAVKLTIKGNNQLTHLSTWVFALIVAICISVQMNYFNKALEIFHTNIVNPIYYVFFSTATIFSSVLLNNGLNTSGGVNTISLLCGFVTIFIGVYLLTTSRNEVAERGYDPYAAPASPTAYYRGSTAHLPQSGRIHTRNSSQTFLESGVLNPRLSLDPLFGPPRSSLSMEPTAYSGRRQASVPPTPRTGGFRHGHHRKSSSIYQSNNAASAPARAPAQRSASGGPVRHSPQHLDDQEEGGVLFDVDKVNKKPSSDIPDLDQDPFSLGGDMDDDDEYDAHERMPLQAKGRRKSNDPLSAAHDGSMRWGAGSAPR
ncbi:DUF803-domain-containing protein [Atractiella rhizophila]|nr:DUF803-domain-containing protein [Atractiella rhizophila]